MRNSARVFANTFLAGSLIMSISSCRESPARSLSQAESSYADLMDDSSIIAAIDSGLFTSYRGKDRAAWKQIQEEKYKEVTARLERISEKALSPTDARALMLIHKGVDSISEGQASLAPKGRCKDAQSRDLADLHSALYSCFEELGNNLQFEGQRLTRVSALDLLSQIAEPQRRKALFMAFVPLWKALNGNDEPQSPYRRLIAQSAADAAKNGSPVDDAARTLGVPAAQIEAWLVQILDAWRETSGTQPIEPWDYRYLSGKADRLLAAAILRESLLPITQRYYKDLGADLKQLGIFYDLDPRPGKAPLAYTDFVVRGHMVKQVWQPTVVYTSANYDRGGLGLLNELVHENGHGVHMMALHTRPAFMDLGDPVFYEAFADVPSWDTYEPVWQQKYLGKSAPESDSLRALFSGVMLDVAWALFEVRMLHNPAADPNAVWTVITSRYLHVVPHPELAWWAVRVQLVSTPGEMVNYGMGAVITADMRHRIQESLGPFATGNPQWYPWISEHLLRHGMEHETSLELKEFLGRPVSPKALLEDIQRIGTASSLNSGCPTLLSEAIDQIRLHALEPGLDRSSGCSGRHQRMFEIAIKRASYPQGEPCGGVRPQFPLGINPMLQDVRGSSLFTVRKRRNNRVLFLALETVSEYNVVPALQLP
jgi:hypothetical protein